MSPHPHLALFSAVMSKSRPLLHSSGHRSLTNMSQLHQNQCFYSSAVFSVSSHSASTLRPSSLSPSQLRHHSLTGRVTVHKVTRKAANLTDLSACTSRGPAAEPAWGRAPCMSHTRGTSHLQTRPRIEKCAPEVFYTRLPRPELC